MNNEIITYDMAKFGHREMKMATDLMVAYTNGKYYSTDYELDNNVKVAFNMHSGYVFLTDEDYQAFIEMDGKLYAWLNCSYCGAEGSEDEFSLDQDGNCEECKGK